MKFDLALQELLGPAEGVGGGFNSPLRSALSEALRVPATDSTAHVGARWVQAVWRSQQPS
jgi:hypothetical protein